jgi:hypothetical protein
MYLIKNEINNSLRNSMLPMNYTSNKNNNKTRKQQICFKEKRSFENITLTFVAMLPVVLLIIHFHLHL